ncbi:hypothetical protein BJY04DRAFT_225248 [Aspergillus karnatakaensis]|uniref:DUF1203 domain-containing protein n=1 Tax=Aspergillus karnatakaensis TaxID=1810916 RepID=UPI003CCCC6FC
MNTPLATLISRQAQRQNKISNHSIRTLSLYHHHLFPEKELQSVFRRRDRYHNQHLNLKPSTSHQNNSKGNKMKFTPLPAPLAVSNADSHPSTIRKTVDQESSYPCRRCLHDGKTGEEILLISYNPFLGSSPYTGPGPIFVHRECTRYECDGSVPEQQARRLLSVRAYDPEHMMVDMGVVQGRELKGKVVEIFTNDKVEYIHIHYAGAGCFAVRVDR